MYLNCPMCGTPCETPEDSPERLSECVRCKQAHDLHEERRNDLFEAVEAVNDMLHDYRLAYPQEEAIVELGEDADLILSFAE